ncbi:MAG: T9SS type A sorting domain-containing protein [Cyclobacteriaceae bacterium]|nr:T9SS type A sorting domain-containing protein [Cyclobacteriaceae bacterium]
MSWIGVESDGDADYIFDQSQAESGKLIVTKNATVPMDYPDGTQLFSLRFKSNDGISETTIRFNSSATKFKASEGISIPAKTKNALIRILQYRNINGNIATSDGTTIKGALVKAESPDELIENSSDTGGNYMLNAFEQSSYTVSATRPDASKLTDAVTTLDIIKTRRHILQIEELGNPYQVIAADVNGSNSITALDLAEMRRVVLGMDQSFRSGLNWLIIPETNDLSNDPFSYSTTASIALTDLSMTLDMVGVKVGDVDNSWSPSNNNRRLNDKILFSMDQIALSDDLIEIPVIATSSNSLSGYQFSISWDPNEFEFAGIYKGLINGFFNEENIQNGVLSTMWDEESGKSMEVPKGGILFILKFKASSESASGTIDITSSVTEAVAFDDRLNAMGIEAIPANLNMEELRNGKLQLLQNVPNPFDYSTDISFKTVEAGKVTLTIVNMLGETLYIHEANYKPGYHHLQWNKQQSTRQLTPGVYLYRIECNGESAVKKMMIR